MGTPLSIAVRRLLPTPRAIDGRPKSNGPRQDTVTGMFLYDDAGRRRDAGERVELLKTPTAQLAINGGSQHPEKRKAGGHGPTLADQAEWEIDLLPTPTQRDWRSGESNVMDRNARPLNEVAVNRLGHTANVDWGLYARAVLRWEHVLGRLVPHPLEAGRQGKGRLSAAFVEWMMGLPEGWVTDVPGLTRNDQLKALGNGVVPQQAVLGIMLLLERLAGV